MSIIADASAHNFFQREARINITITPFTPAVVTAVCRLDQIRYKLSNTEFQNLFEERLLEDLGIYYDAKTNYIFDSKGNYYSNYTQIDSLFFFLSLENKTWPCIPPRIIKQINGTSYDQPILRMSDWPCHVPDIQNLQTMVFLENDKGEILFPNAIQGPRHSTLTTEEKVLVVFNLQINQNHFLRGSEKILFCINNIDKNVKFEIPLSLFQNNISTLYSIKR